MIYPGINDVLDEAICIASRNGSPGAAHDTTRDHEQQGVRVGDSLYEVLARPELKLRCSKCEFFDICDIFYIDIQ